MAEIIEDADKEHENHTREEEINPEIQSRPGPELNLENVLKSLPLFAEQIKEKRSLSPLIKILVPSLESQTVIITMTRQQEELLGDTKIQWQAFLRQYFNNQAITLQIRIDEQANTKREAYTQDEQFKEMLEENEVFRQLVSKLKLKLKK